MHTSHWGLSRQQGVKVKGGGLPGLPEHWAEDYVSQTPDFLTKATSPLELPFQDSLTVPLGGGGDSVSCLGQVSAQLLGRRARPHPHADHPQDTLGPEPLSYLVLPTTHRGKPPMTAKETGV